MHRSSLDITPPRNRSPSGFKDRVSGASTVAESLSFVSSRPDMRWDPITEYYVCELCGTKHTDEDQFDIHVLSRKHKGNLSWREYEEADSNPSMARMGDPELGIPTEIEVRGAHWFKCTLCECMIGDAETVRSHCLGKKHLSLLNRSQYISSHASPQPKIQKAPPTVTMPTSFNSELSFKIYSEHKQLKEPKVCSLLSTGWASPDSPRPESDYDGLAMSPLAEVGSYKTKGGRVIPPPPNYCPNTPSR